MYVLCTYVKCCAAKFGLVFRQHYYLSFSHHAPPPPRRGEAPSAPGAPSGPLRIPQKLYSAHLRQVFLRRSALHADCASTAPRRWRSSRPNSRSVSAMGATPSRSLCNTEKRFLVAATYSPTFPPFCMRSRLKALSLMGASTAPILGVADTVQRVSRHGARSYLL